MLEQYKELNEKLNNIVSLEKFLKVENIQLNLTNLTTNSLFQRLMDKTQVVTKYGKEDIGNNLTIESITNRLTHSLEVSENAKLILEIVNNSLKTKMKENLKKKFSNFDDFLLESELNKRFENFSPLSSIVLDFVCRSHDIGHPPFGHKGEKSLNKFLKQYGVPFEGNANNLVVLMKEGFNETLLLYGVTKYERILKSNFENYNKDKNYFPKVEKGIYEEHYEELSIKFNSLKENIKTYFSYFDINLKEIPNLYMDIMEFSDDISYLTKDLEDFVLYFNKDFRGVETFGDENLRLLMNNINSRINKNNNEPALIKESIDNLRKYLIQNIVFDTNTLKLSFSKESISKFLSSLKSISKDYYDLFKNPEHLETLENLLFDFKEQILDASFEKKKKFIIENISSTHYKTRMLNNINSNIELIKDIRNYVGSLSDSYIVSYGQNIRKKLSNNNKLNFKF